MLRGLESDGRPYKKGCMMLLIVISMKGDVEKYFD